MKTDQNKRQTKERAKGLRAADFLKTRCFGHSEGEGSDSYEELGDTWPVLDLYFEGGECTQPAADAKDILRLCVKTLAASPVARMLIKEAAQEGWKIGLEDHCGYDFHLDVPEKTILLDDNGLSPSALERSEYFRNALLVSLVRALRDAWQEKRHGGFDEKYGPEAILMLERVRAADCDVMAVLVGWELRSEGHSDLWRHLIGSEEGDVAMAFSGYLERDPSAAFSGAALAVAFNQWYRDHARVNACDHETLEYMDCVMRDNPGGNPFGHDKLSAVGVEVLSCLPDKSAYLQGKGRNILSDPMYAGLCDSINQSHLMQLVYDLKVVHVQGVPFRDAGLADKIFPEGELTKIPTSESETR